MAYLCGLGPIRLLAQPAPQHVVVRGDHSRGGELGTERAVGLVGPPGAEEPSERALILLDAGHATAELREVALAAIVVSRMDGEDAASRASMLANTASWPGRITASLEAKARKKVRSTPARSAMSSTAVESNPRVLNSETAAA